MKTALTAIFCLLMQLTVKAQQNFFIYIRADEKQPFSAHVDDRVLNSSSGGYLVIPKLTAGDHPITIGFPNNVSPEEHFVLHISKNDDSYVLKRSGSGWLLTNADGQSTAVAAVPLKETPPTDAFTSTLSQVTNTSPGPPPAAVVASLPAPSVRTEATIVLMSSSNTAAGVSRVYRVPTGTGFDTVNVFFDAVPAMQSQPAASTTPAAEATPGKTVGPPVADNRFLNMDLPNPNTKKTAADSLAADIPRPIDVQKDRPVVAFNSDCRERADDADFLKLRKRMAAQNSEESMAEASVKYFRAKCYSTEQVKNLSVLFLTDAGRYRFFDNAYPHVFDTDRFAQLQSELHDTYYINRFRAMLRQ